MIPESSFNRAKASALVQARLYGRRLGKRGVPSRAEITDAAMGERAECVMLNKGPHIVEAVAALDDILKRMQAHQSKKRPMFRPLRLADRFGTDPRNVER